MGQPGSNDPTNSKHDFHDYCSKEGTLSNKDGDSFSAGSFGWGLDCETASRSCWNLAM
jgi:hypothetical protein